MNIVKWALALAVGGFLLFFGFLKFSGNAHIFPFIEYNADRLGFPLSDLFFPLVNYATGLLELVAGVLVILPMTRKIGAPLAVAPFLGAFVFHLSPLLGVITPNGYSESTPDGVTPLADALSSGGPFVREHFTAETGPVLFALAAVFLIVAIANAVVQRREA
ncbi:MAG: hypothetical protein AAFX03_14690 [Pseudomonadota bacterium]